MTSNHQVLRLFTQKLMRLYSQQLTSHQQELMARNLPKRRPIDGVQQILIVASGKGGVGKSTTSVNLAVTLSQMGKQIGILDADIFGPSVPLMMNIHETPLVDDNNQMIPPINFGVKCLSMGLLIDESKPIVWRGPLVMSAIQRLIHGAQWRPLDILIVDTPPGTGDIHLSLAQNLPIAGALLISTPQRAALDVTRRGAEMYKTLKIPLVGIVENMHHAICQNCGDIVNIFGNETKKFANELDIEILQSIPIVPLVTECCDNGLPLVLKEPTSDFAKSYRILAEKICKFLDKQMEIQK